ncbi:MAG: TauD/TfdA family dioxygenase [Gammaproteobacteria bacterium]|jgi:taurine dioxygenase|nr:TauD/TfdA family dioxygenase [Gammaproteobacteria bacterium]MDP6617285.1 TauD/TfdA family dioxygenase [Gammaproteobacteria bacterium]MDP6694063.1 TauD/TfdA family dioxygenase [Gammaproteobacteria bacterium]
MAQLATKSEPIAVKSYQSFEVIPQTGSFGALINDIQVADSIEQDELFADLYQAWLDYQVLFFRDQELSPAQHLKLGERFGEIQKPGYAPSLEGYEGVWVQEYPDMYDGIVTDLDWHADSSFREQPTRGSLLYALDVPVGGGDTVWSDMCAAYEDLAPPWKTMVDGLSSIHDNMTRNLFSSLARLSVEEFAKVREYLPPHEHPVVCTHPETSRKYLFVSELMTREIVGMNDRESRAVLDFLLAHQTRPEYQCRFNWEPKSLVLWDNFSTLHRGIFDFGQSHRLMHRVSFNTPWQPA